MLELKSLLKSKTAYAMLFCFPLWSYAQQDVSLEKTLEQDSISKIHQLIYFKTPKQHSTASVSKLSGNAIATTPTFGYLTSLAGQLPGLKVNQSNGQPLNEDVSYQLRGRTPIILIDGIPRSVTEIGMQEIESISVLKDAVSLAMLGIRGADGAISIVTKKGYTDRTQINFSAQYGIQKPLQNLIGKPLDAYRYALLYNEALKNDGLSVKNNGFSETALASFKDGNDPLVYPNVRWPEQVMENNAAVARYNLNTRGGNKYVKYFVNLEHFSQNGFLKTDAKNNYNTNTNAKGYFVRSNVDVKLSDLLEAGVYIQGRILNANSPGNDGTDNIFQSILNTPNSAYPIYNLDGTYSGSSTFQNNILAQTIASGYAVANTRTVLTDFYLKRSLDDVVKGLWLKARASFFSNLRENYVRNKSFAVFQLVNNDVEGPIYKQYGNNTEQNNSNNIAFQNRSNFQELSVGYSSETEKHGIDLILLANRDNLVNGSDLPYTIQGISGHAAYHYDNRYLAEVSFAVNGANRYPTDGGFKYGTFPAIGLGWNIHRENFLKDSKWISRMKLFGSYGSLGRDNANYYTYIQSYNGTPETFFGSTAGSAGTIGESYLASANPTWAKVNMLNLGIDGALLNDRLIFELTYYKNKYRDLNITRKSNNTLLGISYPNENIGKQDYTGFETELGWRDHTSKLTYHALLNASFQKSKMVYEAEPPLAYSWMSSSGHPVGQTIGYIAEGLYRNDTELQSSPTVEGYTPQLGDIRYRDLNGDGVINQYDQGPIGSEKPQILLGVNLGFSVANIDFSILFQGMINREVYLSGNSYREFNGGTGQAYDTHLDRWTLDNPGGSYPRLSTSSGPQSGAVNNNVYSTFWLRSGNYLRIRNIELGYTLPTTLTQRAKIKSARIFANGFNLHTFSSNTFNGADPENFRGLYPIQKVISFGLNIQL
ncbi:SusC/RagA family TonB-linked outer membrane protein [Sphingobacterium sp. WOUb80]|uniref:SusC/RagA family TonB-linked outer membrane protein n=1 Tax=Sphingobacterium sp. WOUb80 TaxID=3234028 RepID=UPI003CF59CD3